MPYEQGALFLVFLEHRFGREAFDAFLRRWFDSHAFKSATTDQFLLFLKEQLLATKPGVVTDAEVQEWLHSETVPAFAVLPKSDAFERVERARDAWLQGGPINALADTHEGMVHAGVDPLRRFAAAERWRRRSWPHSIDSSS